MKSLVLCLLAISSVAFAKDAPKPKSFFCESTDQSKSLLITATPTTVKDTYNLNLFDQNLTGSKHRELGAMTCGFRVFDYLDYGSAPDESIGRVECVSAYKVKIQNFEYLYNLDFQQKPQDVKAYSLQLETQMSVKDAPRFPGEDLSGSRVLGCVFEH
jgi:hypothetical protein